METFWQPRNTNANGTIYIYGWGMYKYVHAYLRSEGRKSATAKLGKAGGI